MTLNVIFLFLLTLMLISNLYNFVFIKILKNEFVSQDEYKSFIEFGAEKYEFKMFIIFRVLHLNWLVNSKNGYKIIRIYSLIMVCLAIVGYICLFLLNSSPYGEFFRVKI